MAINTNSSDVAKRELEKMENPVKVLLFTTLDAEGLRHCPACQDAAQFVKELASMSDGKFEVEEYSISENHDICEQYHVDRVPTIIFPDFGIRYTGAPIGMEAAPFLQTIVVASTGKTGIPADMVSDLKQRAKGKIIRTIVTPTCTYCPTAVAIANRIAIASEGGVISEIVESYEHGDLAAKYKVSGVPAIVVGKVKDGEVYDDEVAFLGLPSGRDLVEKLTGHARVMDTGMYT